jgi:hypothetical protein
VGIKKALILLIALYVYQNLSVSLDEGYRYRMSEVRVLGRKCVFFLDDLRNDWKRLNNNNNNLESFVV